MNLKIHAEKLNNGETVQFRPRGNSMRPKINSGDLVTVSPNTKNIKKGDIVLCHVKGKYFLHLVKAIKNGSYQIGNNKGHVNGWTRTIFGKVTKVE
jgi:phage repressor protein C with HTH and peptisase S24 domain